MGRGLAAAAILGTAGVKLGSRVLASVGSLVVGGGPPSVTVLAPSARRRRSNTVGGRSDADKGEAMTRFAVARRVGTMVLIGGLAAGCSSSSKPATSATSSGGATTSTAAGGASSVTVTAGDYAFAGVPATLPAGIEHITFVNKGSVPHEMAFLKVTNNTNTAAILADLANVFQGKPFPADFLAVNGVHDTQPGQTTVTAFNLTAGQYVAYCADTGIVGSTKQGVFHFRRGMFKRITVTGTGGTTAPTAQITLTAHDYGFDTSALKAGTHTVAFKNLGPTQWHFADIMEFPAGTTIAQAQAAIPKVFLAPTGTTVPGVPNPTDLGGSQAASPGNGNTFTLTLTPGRVYVVVCFLPDKAGGLPHVFAHHMYHLFTIN